MKKGMQVVKKILNILLVILIVLFVFVVFLQRFSNNRVSIFSYRMFTVVSGSMEPKYKVGDVLIAKETKPKDIKVGDAISYLGKVGQFKNKVITHEVVEIEKDVNNKYLYHTKGLANVIEDPIVEEDQLYGVVIHKAVVLSFIYGIVSKPIGMFIFVLVPIMYIIVSEIISTLIEKEEKRRSKAKEE